MKTKEKERSPKSSSKVLGSNQSVSDLKGPHDIRENGNLIAKQVDSQSVKKTLTKLFYFFATNRKISIPSIFVNTPSHIQAM